MTKSRKFLVSALSLSANERLRTMAVATGWTVAGISCLEFVDLPLKLELPPADWLVLTSPRGAARLISALNNREISIDAVKIAAVGEATAAVLWPALEVDFLPSVANARTLAAEIPAAAGQKIIAFSTPDAGPDLRRGLEERGIECVAMHAYRGQPRFLLPEEQVLLRQADAVAIASGLVAAHLCETVDNNLPLVCMGRQTAEAAERAGAKRIVVAQEPTLAATLAACEMAISPF